MRDLKLKSWADSTEDSDMINGLDSRATRQKKKSIALTGYSRDQFKRPKNTYGSECAQVNAFLGFSSYTPQGVGLGTQNGDVSEKDIN